MSTVRLRRLKADFDKLQDYVQLHPRVKLIQFDGDPPERYQLEYRIRSLRQVGSELTEVKSHMVEIVLPRNYPRTPPQCRMLTPVFHPNIAPHAICVGDHWSAGESLQSIVIRIGEMLAYQSYNVKSPLNGDAARWVEQNAEDLPLDEVSLLVEEHDTPQDEESPFEEDDASVSSPIPPSRSRSAPTRLPGSLTTPASPTQAVPHADALPPAEPRKERSVSPPPLAPTTPATSVSISSELPRSAASASAPAPPGPEPEKIAAEKIATVCPQCGTRYRVKAEHRGRSVTCQKCGVAFVIS